MLCYSFPFWALAPSCTPQKTFENIVEIHLGLKQHCPAVTMQPKQLHQNYMTSNRRQACNNLVCHIFTNTSYYHIHGMQAIQLTSQAHTGDIYMASEEEDFTYYNYREYLSATSKNMPQLCRHNDVDH